MKPRIVCGLFYGTHNDSCPVVYREGCQYRVKNVDRFEACGYGPPTQNGLPVAIVVTKEDASPDEEESGECYVISESSLAFVPGSEPVTSETPIIREWLVTEKSGRRKLVIASSIDGANRSANRDSVPSDDFPTVPMSPDAPLWICRYRHVENDFDSCTLVAADNARMAEGLVKAYYCNTIAGKPVIEPADFSLIDLRTKSPEPKIEETSLDL